MDIVRQKPRYLAVSNNLWFAVLLDPTYVALMPPISVYRITPTGKRKVEAMMCIPVLFVVRIDLGKAQWARRARDEIRLTKK